ncbi:cell surface protein [Comamonas sp. NLF-1-9]|uniref:cell surface protein n=1 Tax=Comamonas sp. NLF-1-9 TaxID=2853163 RepID=UPI001C452683|nr:cell surface protein [Comamonas sp. NLF-1-9]QXL83545.1 cell surface protein [Comamonas sp. NLF-1-9]
MRKNLLALSIAAMVGGLAAGAANAAVIAAGTTATGLAPTVTGVGHILTIPYFTTQGTNKTLLNIVNTDTTNGKAVKLRFRGAANSDDVFDITVYLSPGDAWSAEVAADAAGFSRLVTNDNSCTLPSRQDIRDANNGRFKIHRVLNADPAQTREGYVEILNTADIPAGSALYTAIKHVNGVAPCTAGVMDAQEADLIDPAPAAPPFATDAENHAYANARGYDNPTGGLMANWVVVNVAGFASHSGEAVAVEATGGTGAGAIVWWPQTTDTPIYQADGAAITVADMTADPLLNHATFASQVANYDFPDLSTPYTTFGGVGGGIGGLATPEEQADDLTASLATTSVTNEYMTADGFSTDWVFSMPTRRYAVAMGYHLPAATRLLLRGGAGNDYFNALNTAMNITADRICVTPGNMRAYDREEGTQSVFVISPDANFRLCGETSVLSFNNEGASVLGAAIARANIKTKGAEGWFRLNTPSANAIAGGVSGLPIIGYAAAKVSGANLGGTWKHRTAR